MIDLAPLASVPDSEIEALLDAAFGADRRTRTAYRLRAGTTAIGALSFAALDSAGRLAGSLQSWPLELAGSDRRTPVVMIGPVAVRPDAQGSGIGTALMRRVLDVADAGEADALMMIGDPDYYGRFGFGADATRRWTIDGPVERHRLLARGSVPTQGILRPR